MGSRNSGGGGGGGGWGFIKSSCLRPGSLSSLIVGLVTEMFSHVCSSQKEPTKFSADLSHVSKKETHVVLNSLWF